MTLRLSAIALASLTLVPMAAADDLRINGFMNITAGHLSTDDISQDGYDDGIKFDQDTLVGLQMAKQVNSSTSATVQLISRGSQNFDTQASWAYLTYAASDNTDVRAGRLRTPFFYYSDFLEVGYAYHWVTPPSLVYRLDALSSINGVDISQRFTLGSTDGLIQLYSGRYQDDLTFVGDQYNVELKRAGGLVFSLSHNSLSGRISYHQADLTMDINPLNAGPNGRALDNLAAAATLAGVGKDFVADNDTVKFYQASLSYDNGTSVLIAEWTKLDQTTAAILDDSALLVSAARRINAFTLHLTYAQAEDATESGTVGSIQQLAEYKETSVIAGVRYDYDSSTALKLDIQHHDEELVNGQAGDSGLLYNLGMSLVF
ncbi:hypothetical protein GCM10011297_19270 [Bacterioplanes sanyensis]|uniref:hypothetical protein n=1 Tax=Bacterioplanes sanyensis TaxID=1249553 RepID=UPI00167425F5|nr:hypothetical protein [Bacterioplanes sanyensis]GGY46573.1 hypothetical protein GCM10011297_19270 [Bacterioplanes sanyensis]